MDDEMDDDDGWTQPPNKDGHLRIMAEMCSTCIFRPGNPMHLEKGRVAGMLAGVRADDSFVTCHKALGTGQPGVICRGSNDAHPGQMFRIAQRLGLVVEMTEEEVLAEAQRLQDERDPIEVYGTPQHEAWLLEQESREP